MTAENGEEAWISNPLSLLKHTMSCLEGGSCQVPGCLNMRLSMGHSQNCTNAECPAPPCIAIRQLTGSITSPATAPPPLSLDDIFRAAIKVTEIRPSIKLQPELRPKTVQRSLSSSQSSSSSTESLFKIPRGKPRR